MKAKDLKKLDSFEENELAEILEEAKIAFLNNKTVRVYHDCGAGGVVTSLKEIESAYRSAPMVVDIIVEK